MVCMDVTDVIRDRMQEPRGLQATAVVSALLHAVALAAIVLASGGLFGARPQQLRSVMTISLGGGNNGPETGGMTSIGGRPVQTVTPPEEAKRPEPVRPPAARTPAMTLPKPGPATARAAPPAVKQAPDEARGRTPTRGEETSAGTAVAETGVRGQGFGLSTGGGAGSGSRLDVADFCCPDYLILMVEKIRSNWNARAGSTGEVMVTFTIDRDGRIGGVAQETSSGNAVLDLNAMRALVATRQLLPLPAAFPNPTLTVHLNFQYTR
jgi:TonB family protein